MTKTKKCTNCGISKIENECFHRRHTRKGELYYRPECKDCRNKKTRQYMKKVKSTEKGKEKLRRWAREKYHNKIEKYREMRRNSERKRLANGTKYAYRKRRYHEDPIFNISMRLRRRVLSALKGKNKSASTQELTGCTWIFLKQHIEKQFKEGMTWENRHLWHVDHIRPCASFDLSKEEEQRKCFHYSNLQPLWARENLIKGSKYTL